MSKEATEAARELAKTAAESLQRDLVESQLSSIGEKIAQALEEGVRPADIYKQLDEITMLDSNRLKRYNNAAEKLRKQGMSEEAIEERLKKFKEKLIKERQKTIARTEGSKAVSEARITEAKNRGAKYKGWVTSQDERLCDECSGNEADGIIEIGQPFSSGVFNTPAHPLCRCSIFYITNESAKEIAEEAQAERIAETKAMRERAEEERKKKSKEAEDVVSVRPSDEEQGEQLP